MGRSGVAERTDRVTAAAAIISAVLGLASAGVSAYWALGGDGLLDTVGGDIERWGREREPAVVVILWFIVALKTIVAIAAPVLSGSATTGSRRGRGAAFHVSSAGSPP